MTRRLVALGVVLAAGLTAGADEGKPVKIVARGIWPHLPTHTGPLDRDIHTRVLRTPEELAKAAGTGGLVAVPKTLKVDGIDFKTQMVLAVEDGSQPMVGVSGGGPPSAPLVVNITRVEKDEAGKTMTVYWKRVPRGKDQLLTRPLEAVLVERFAGEVKFHQIGVEARPDTNGTEVKVLARAAWPDGWPPEAPRQEWVVRSADELIDPRLRAPEPVLERMRAEALARYKKALGVEAIDFTKQMVLGVSGGVQPAGARVEVTRIEQDDKGQLTVTWKLHGPKTGAKAEKVEHPAEVVLVERSAGAVRFRREGKE